jgi:hypothetical protein
MTKRPDSPAPIERFAPTEIRLKKHGFADCPRDYFLEIWASFSNADLVPEEEANCQYLHILLRGCVEANYQLCVPPEDYPTLMDDTYTDYSRWCGAGCPPGIVWDSWAVGTGDWRYVADSGRAQAWAEKMKMPMREVEVKTSVFVLSLIFHEAQISEPPLPEYLKQEGFWKSVNGKLRSRIGR